MIKRFFLLTVFLILSRADVFCDPALWEEAIKNMETIKMENYAYTTTKTEKGKKTVELYEPLLEDDVKWQLIMKEDKFPTPEEQKAYREKKQKELKNQQKQAARYRSGQNRQQNFSISMNNFIDTATLKVIAETDKNVTYTFKPAADSDNQQTGPMFTMMQNMDCLLRINKTGKYIESVMINSPAPFSPSFGVEIKNFKMEMFFAPEAAGKEVLIRETRVVLQGSAFIISQFDQDIVTTYGNYQFRGVPGEEPS